MNPENSKPSHPHRLLFNIVEKECCLIKCYHFYTWENIKSLYRNYKFKVLAPTWNDKFELPDRSFSVSDIQDYFDYIIKKHETLADNPPIKIYINKIETE